jgi:hydrogenase expression/formation protein HypC
MCLAVPARILEKRADVAQVDFGDGVKRAVNIALVDATIGDYVIVHAGFAIEVLDEHEAMETLRLWDEILAFEETSR